MLLKDGKEFNLEDPENKKELDGLKKAFPNFERDGKIVVKYHPNLLRFSALNQKWESPEARTLPNRQVLNRPGKGNQTWIYCENYEAHAATGAILVRTPWDFELTGNKTINWLNKDFAFFLWISGYCGNGESPGVNPVYVFENREAEAKARLDKEKKDARVKSLVLNDDTEGGLADYKIQEMASAYGMSSKLSIYEMRQGLYTMASKERMGFDKFINLLENDGEKIRRVAIQNAKEAGILICKGIQIEPGTGNNQGWRLLDAAGETMHIFGKHRKQSKNANIDQDKFLWEAIAEDNSIYNKIEAELERLAVAEQN